MHKTTSTKRKPAPVWRDNPNEAAERAKHDRAVADYSPGLVMDTAEDLRRKRYWNQKDPEHRWGMARLAALLRRADSLRLLA